MSLWHVEWLRLMRTRRFLILGGVYLFFGLLGPVTARYLPDLLANLDEGAQVLLPEPTPADGITQYLGNAQQLGLLAVIFVAGAALAIDANTETSIFFRTRASIRSILEPRFAVNAAAAVIAFLIGAIAAWYETLVLLGSIDAPAYLAGLTLYAVYLVFAVALTALVAAIFRNIPATVIVSLVVLIALGLVGLIRPVADWLPSTLLGATDILIRGGEFDMLPGLVVTFLAIPACLFAAVLVFERREV